MKCEPQSRHSTALAENGAATREASIFANRMEGFKGCCLCSSIGGVRLLPASESIPTVWKWKSVPEDSTVQGISRPDSLGMTPDATSEEQI
jgi:hypothetical protein